MHELAIAEGIANVVEARATEHQAVQVKRVRLLIGEASGVVTDSLTFCFEMVASVNPLLAGAQLTIDTRPHRAWCSSCAQEFTVTNFVAQCPDCGTWSNDIRSGTELQVLDIEIETPQDKEGARWSK